MHQVLALAPLHKLCPLHASEAARSAALGAPAAALSYESVYNTYTITCVSQT